MTTRLATLGLLAALLALPVAAQADSGSGGDRQPAGGGFMSSYVSDPYHDPRSLHSQRRGTGQLLGAPMFHDGHRALARRDAAAPHWASGTGGRLAR